MSGQTGGAGRGATPRGRWYPAAAPLPGRQQHLCHWGSRGARLGAGLGTARLRLPGTRGIGVEGRGVGPGLGPGPVRPGLPAPGWYLGRNTAPGVQCIPGQSSQGPLFPRGRLALPSAPVIRPFCPRRLPHRRTPNRTTPRHGRAHTHTAHSLSLTEASVTTLALTFRLGLAGRGGAGKRPSGHCRLGVRPPARQARPPPKGLKFRNAPLTQGR